MSDRKFYCVASVYQGKVHSLHSCTTKQQRAAAHLAALLDAGMSNVEIVERSSKPRGVSQPPKGRPRTQGSLFPESAKGGQGSLFGVAPGEKILDKLPEGTNLKCQYDELCRWGDKMALVTSDVDFDPEVPAHKYQIWLTDIPGDDRLVGQTTYFRDRSANYWETSFSYRDPRDPAYGYHHGGRTGRVVTKDAPITVWVRAKLSDLQPKHDRMVQQTLRDQGFQEPYRYPLSAAKWRKLIDMQSFKATQDADPEIANAANEIVERAAGHRSAPTMASDESVWNNIPGVFVTTKKGGIKFVVAKNPRKGMLFG